MPAPPESPAPPASAAPPESPASAAPPESPAPIAFGPLREALLRLARDPACFEDLCRPGPGEGRPLAELEPDLVATLAAAGVIQIVGERAKPRLWVKLRGPRPYLMSLSPGAKGDPYRQDVWPETEAMLAYLQAARPGSLLDVGTGSGPVAIEAALAGFTVTATDLYPSALALAAWNASLHGVTLDLQLGHMFEPVAGRRFDHVVSAPHYTGPADLLRVEALQTGLACVAPGGTMYITTFLEWAPGELPGVVESVLRPLADAGAAITVRPIPASVKRRWFTVPDAAVPGLTGRHRFGIAIRPDGPGGLDFAWPSAADQEPDHVVPLYRLSGPRADRAAVRGELSDRTAGAWDKNPVATLTGADDLEALEALCKSLRTGVAELEGPMSFQLLDGCRFGARECVHAHGAIVDIRGGVRPCAHAPAVGRVTDTSKAYHLRMVSLRSELETRRGCADCSAAPTCSKCAFPAFLDEARYCDFMRRHAYSLPTVHTLIRILNRSYPDAYRLRSLWVKLRPGPRLIAATARPFSMPSADDPALESIREAFALTGAMLLASEARGSLEIAGRLGDRGVILDRPALELTELVLEGVPRHGLAAYANRRGFDADAVDQTLAQVQAWFGEGQAS